MRITKRIIALIISAIIIVFPVISLADLDSEAVIYTTSSTDTLPSDYTGNATGIIFVKNPETLVSVTSTKSYVISAVAQSDTSVSLYSYNQETEKYEKMVGENGTEMVSTVGASGLYAQSVNLNTGKNIILVVATNANGTETIKLDVTLNLGFINKIKTFTVGLSQIFGN